MRPVPGTLPRPSERKLTLSMQNKRNSRTLLRTFISVLYQRRREKQLAKMIICGSVAFFLKKHPFPLSRKGLASGDLRHVELETLEGPGWAAVGGTREGGGAWVLRGV